MVPVMDNRHHEIRLYVQYITNIYFSKEFIKLRQELENIYRQSGLPQAQVVAFTDTLYATMMQQEPDFLSR